MKNPMAFRRELLIGAVAVIVVLFALRYLTQARGGLSLAALGQRVSAFGDVSLPSGQAPELDVSAAVATEQQSATSPDGKYQMMPPLIPSYTIPNAAL